MATVNSFAAALSALDEAQHKAGEMSDDDPTHYALTEALEVLDFLVRKMREEVRVRGGDPI